ncbi:enoyl-CoA hydratase-related protein [Streptomyces sp. M19]
MADTVLYELSDGLATITLNRPEAMNALNVELKEALRDALRRAADDPEVRAVLLTGSGRAFCVGQDLKEHTALLAAAEERGDDSTMRTVERHYNPITTAIAGMPKPVVAAVNGPRRAPGGFAFAADHRIAADSASFTTAFAAVGLGADSGLSWTLQRLVGYGRASELMLFPRVVPAQEAWELGMVDAVVPAAELAAEAGAVARRLAAGPTVAYAAIKESLAYAAAHGLPEALAKEAELQTRAGASEDHRTAVRAFVNKEKPTFRGR